MIRIVAVAIATIVSFAGLYGAEASGAAKVWDDQLKSLEHEFVPLVEAMPAEKFAFVPTAGEFKNSRTFQLQAMHAATVLNEVSAAILQQKTPVEVGKAENGPALKTKAEVVKYVKDAFVYAHKAMSTLTSENQMGMVKSAFEDKQTTRLYMASVAIWHSYDHYGQMVVYARMNSVVPPASR
jgi:hypothetical protein